jgi:hypothetical protein
MMSKMLGVRQKEVDCGEVPSEFFEQDLLAQLPDYTKGLCLEHIRGVFEA